MFRPLTLLTLALGIWLGFKADRFLHEGTCLSAGGRVDPRGLCMGARQQ
jgi:hypothetical protein